MSLSYLCVSTEYFILIEIFKILKSKWYGLNMSKVQLNYFVVALRLITPNEYSIFPPRHFPRTYSLGQFPRKISLRTWDILSVGHFSPDTSPARTISLPTRRFPPAVKTKIWRLALTNTSYPNRPTRQQIYLKIGTNPYFWP